MQSISGKISDETGLTMCIYDSTDPDCRIHTPSHITPKRCYRLSHDAVKIMAGSQKSHKFKEG
jgi:hypothetical protein